jgi:hypothetical protein
MKMMMKKIMKEKVNLKKQEIKKKKVYYLKSIYKFFVHVPQTLPRTLKIQALDTIIILRVVQKNT